MKSEARRAAELVARRLRHKGFEAVFAGGCVRDILLGLEPQDYDVATDAAPKQVRWLFKKTIPIGERFGVITVMEFGPKVEVTTFRSEGPYTDGRRPEGVRFVSAKEDALRRDFTINALLMDPDTEEVIDYVEGRADMERKVLRAVGDARERFGEDHLRLLRGVRFAARLGYEIERKTREAIVEMAERVRSVSGERVRNELERIIVDSSRARGMLLMDELGLLSHVLPEVDAMKGVPNFRAPVETDVFEHTLEVLGLLETPSFVLALGALLHDVGKPKAYTAGERPRFTRHEVIGEELSRGVCERLRTSAEEREGVCRLVRKHMLLANARKMRLSRLRRLFAEERFLELAELFRADSVASLPAFAESDFSPMDEYEYAMAVYSSIPEEEIAPAPLIRGDDLIAMGLEPGPLFGELLEEVRDAQLEGAVKSKKEGLAMVRRLLEEKGVSTGD